ncbi:MAG: glycosyltransferase [Planctomycetota bacterium]|jgi:glycosyltransferase involved in cell wall biosynthesis
MKKLNVVHIIGAMPVGGVERNLLRILPMLDRDKFNVSMVCIRELGELAAPLQKAGIPVSLKFMKTRYHPVSLWKLAKHLKNVKADIIHCHMRRANTSGRIAGMLAGIPIRLGHERDQGLGKKARHYFIDRILAKFNGPILSVTKGCINYNSERSGIPEDKFQLLYNGLDIDKFLAPRNKLSERRKYGLPDDRPVIGCIGRLHQIKDIPLLIKAFAGLKIDSNPVLLIAGEGKEKENLENLVKECGIENKTIFLPWQHDLPSIYSTLDVFALTSKSEGIANVQLEASAAGIPLVSTRVGIAAEAYTDGTHYIAVDHNEESLRDGIIKALDPAAAENLVTNGREIIKEFSLEKQKSNLEQIYLDLWNNYMESEK